MKQFIKKNKFDLMLLFSFITFIIYSHLVSHAAGIEIGNNFGKFFVEMITFIPLIFILIGLFDVWISKEKIQKHIGYNSGIKGSFWVILLAMLQAGPLYSSFPVAYILWKKGASIRNIFIYLGAFSTLKIPMLAFEITYLGLKFSLLRTFITLPVFIIIALIMEKILVITDFRVTDPGKQEKNNEQN